MTTEPQTEGDLNIQYSNVSSTSDCFASPFSSKFPLGGRMPYRTSFKRLLLPQCSNPVHIQTTRIQNNDTSTRFAVATVLLIFMFSLYGLFFVYSTFPEVTDEEKAFLKLPWNIEDAKQLGIVLNRYKVDHYYHVMSGVFITYIFLQTFAIPGSLFLSILAGFLFPFTIALILVCTCSMVGASLCFLISQLLGRKLIQKYFPKKAQQWAIQVNKHQDNLFNYIVFLRVTPFLPNWFINLSAPVIGVPLFPFAFGTFVGVAPPSFIAIQGGQTLQNMTATDTAFSAVSFVWLIVFGLISLIPIFLKNRFKEKFE